MRVLLVVDGTQGDFQPMLALSLALREWGHDVVIAANPNFAPQAQTYGVEFYAAGLDLDGMFTDPHSGPGSPVRFLRRMWREARRDISRQIEVLLPAARASDLVIAIASALTARTAAEASGKPYLYATISPDHLRSRHTPPITFPIQGLPSEVNAAGWRLAQALVRIAIGGPLDAVRARLGLPSVRDPFEHVIPRGAVLPAFDPEFGTVPADFPVVCGPTGPWQLDDPRELDPAVERFLDAAPPPLYLGFGSMLDGKPESTIELLRRAVQLVGCRAIIYAGYARRETDAAPDAIVVGSLPFAKLFPRCAGVVHHGGPGTMALAARAGVPQVLVPHAYDQFGWGRRLWQQGLTPKPLPRFLLRPGRLARRIQQALGDTQMRARAKELAPALRARDGRRRAVDVLEGFMGAAG